MYTMYLVRFLIPMSKFILDILSCATLTNKKAESPNSYKNKWSKSQMKKLEHKKIPL